MIENDPDFIFSKKFDFSLDKMLERYPDGISNKMIARSLLLTEQDVSEILESIIQKFRNQLKIEVDDESQTTKYEWEE